MKEQPNRPFLEDGRPRCQERIARYIGSWPHFGQCLRAAAVGDRCKQHSPEVRAHKAAKREEQANADRRQRRLEWAGPRFYEALKQIAEGHNDPRIVAREAIKEYKDE